MEKLNDQLQLFQEIMNNFFVKIQKFNINRDPSLMALLKDHLNQISNEKSSQHISANKHYIIFYRIFKARNPRLSEICLYHLEKLISHKFIDGQVYDYTQNEDKDNKIEPNPARRLNETIVDNICEQIQLRDENVNLQVNKVLLSLMTSQYIQIHGLCLQKIIQTIIDIYCNTKDIQTQNSTRHSIMQIIDYIFQKMEESTHLSEEEKQIYRNKKAEANEDRIEEQKSSVQQLSRSLSFEQVQQENINVLTNYYMRKVVANMIDDVCIYDGKIKLIHLQAKEIQDQKAREQYIEDQTKLVPFKCAPLLCDANKIQYQKNKQINIENEKQSISGKFGWCFVCRNSANNFCKDTRVSICSVDCKKKHIEELDSITKLCLNLKKGIQVGYFSDCLQTLVQLCKLSGLDENNGQQQQLQSLLKSKVIVLDQLLSILDKSGAVLLSKKEFSMAIQENLLEVLLKNCFNQEKSVFTLSFAIVVSLVSNFRDNLKQEVGAFLEHVFIKLLESNNSNFSHRMFSLQALGKIFKLPRAVLEIYVNYDCTLDEECLMEKIINILEKISLGRYLKPEYAAVISPPQEQSLKKLALESLIELVKSLCLFCDKCNNNATDLISSQGLVMKQENNEEDEENNLDLSSYLDQMSAFDKIERQRLRKQEIVKAIQKFNYKPQHGINYMVKTKLVEENNVRDMAQFFFANQGIDQEKLGEYYGSDKLFNQQILHEFIELIQFNKMTIQKALRELLSKFQLPKEAQQVDRILEKFGEKYIIDNPDSYKSATAAYTLSYALIMLQTSLHNPSVQEKDRMTVQSFQNLVRGINDGQDLPLEQTENMFYDIKKVQLALHREEISRQSLEIALKTSVRQKQDLFKQETQLIIEKGQEKFKFQKHSAYMQVFSTEHMKPFLHMMWSPIFASLTTVIEQSDDLNIIDTCFNGVIYCIKLLGMFQMDTEKETFVLFLTKNTGLLNQDQKELTLKNIICIKQLLEATLLCGNYLYASWKIFLQCVSQLDYYHAVGSLSRKDSEIISNRKNEKLQSIEIKNSEIIQNNIDSSLIDRIFHNSDKLNSDNILIFIQGLYELSIEEIVSSNNPRTFCMKRIQEVTVFNMDRVKLIWNQIWNILSNFFCIAGTHVNPQIAELAVDLLKQLSLKFLQKQELTHYQFQKQFLDPFEQIYNKMKINNLQQKELILEILNHITHVCFINMKSGWKTIFSVINTALQESVDSEGVVKKDYESLLMVCKKIISKIMSENLDHTLDVFSELIQSLILISKCHSCQSPEKWKRIQEKDRESDISDISLKSIDNLKICFDYLTMNAGMDKLKLEEKLEENMEDEEKHFSDSLRKKQIIFSECQRHLEQNRMPILGALAILVSSDVLKIQKKSTGTLFQILKEKGQTFSKDLWKQIIYSVIRPLFEDIFQCFLRKNQTQEELYYALKKTTQFSFQSIVDLYVENYNLLSPNLQVILNIFNQACQLQNESLSKVTSDAIKNLLNEVGMKFDQNDWKIVINAIQQIHECQLQKDILLLKNTNEEFKLSISELIVQGVQKKQYCLNINVQKNVTQCVIEIIFIQLIKEIFESFKTIFLPEQLEQFKIMLNKSYDYAHEFNKHVYLRYVLWKNGLMSDMINLPGLIKHERESFSGIVKINYELWLRDKSNIDQLQQLLKQIIEYIQQFMNNQVDFIEALRKDYEKSGRRKVSQEQPTDDKFQEYLKKLNLQEIERNIVSQRQNLCQTIFPILDLIEEKEIPSELFQNIVFVLIEISTFSFTRSIQCMTCDYCQNCNQCTCFSPDQYDIYVKKLLQKYFQFTIGKKN